MKINLSKFKKIKSDEHSTTLKHPAGHSFTIAHKGINKDMRQELDSIPHFDEGGEIEDHKAHGGMMHRTQMGPMNPKLAESKKLPHYADGTPDTVQDENKPININVGQPQTPTQDIPYQQQNRIHTMTPEEQTASSPENLPYGVTPADIAQTKAVKEVEQPPQVVKQPESPNPLVESTAKGDVPYDPFGTQATQEAYVGGLNQTKAGYQQMAQAKKAEATQQAALLSPQIQAQTQQLNEYQNHLKNLNDEYQSTVEDIQKGHIDPNHFLDSMDTGAKIKSAIGLIIGGIGSGLTHQPNLASQFLNAQIDRDIEAQRANLGKKQSLLAANMQHFGNIRDAMDMTKATLQGITASQLAQAAAQNGGQAAMGNAQAEIGKLNMQSAGTLGQMAARKTLIGAAAQGKVDPYAVIRTLVPEGEQAETNKELQQAQGMTKSASNIMNAFNRIKEINTVGNRLASPVQSARQIKALEEPLIAQLSKETAGRFTEQDAKYLGSLFPTVGDSEETLHTKQNQIQKLISEKMNFPKLKFYGIDPTAQAPRSSKFDFKK